MNQQEQQGEAQRWEEEAGWLQADPEYLLWLDSFGPWWRALDNLYQEQTCPQEQ
jgi:hypothetical protein